MWNVIMLYTAVAMNHFVLNVLNVFSVLKESKHSH